MLCKLKIHKFFTVSGYYDYNGKYSPLFRLSKKICLKCGVYYVSDDLCLGLNPPQYVQEFVKRGDMTKYFKNFLKPNEKEIMKFEILRGEKPFWLKDKEV